MAVIGLLVLGIVLGATGIQVLRAKNPELLEKMESQARRLRDRLYPARSADEEEEK